MSTGEFSTGIYVCANVDKIQTVVGFVNDVEELWQLARDIGYKDGDTSGISRLGNFVVYTACVGDPLMPEVIKRINEDIANGATHFHLADACGRTIVASHEQWGPFGRTVQVSLNGGESRKVETTEEIWEWLKQEGMSDGQEITGIYTAADNICTIVFPAQIGLPLHTSLMLRINTSQAQLAAQNVLDEVVHMDFSPKTSEETTRGNGTTIHRNFSLTKTEFEDTDQGRACRMTLV